MRRFVWSAGVAAVMAAGMVFMAPVSTRAEETIPAGVYVGGLSLEGLTETEAEKKVSDYVEEKLNQEITLEINETQVTSSAEELGLAWGNQDAVDDALKDTEIKGNLIRRYMKKKDLQVNPVKIELDMDVDQDKVAAFINEKCGESMTEARDASITKENGEFVITPSVVGTAVDIEATKKSLNEAVNGEGTDGITVQATVAEQQPRITTEDLATIKDVLGTFSTDFRTSGASRSTNLAVGAAKINGHVLMPGEVLSGYECMHPFTIDNGYRTATAYENGRSVDSIGGGVCQIATTLYNASLLAELDIVQRQNHSMSVSYVKPSMDAAIAGTYKDIKVRNPYDTPIYVEGYTSGKTLTFTIYGKETRPENREIKFESVTLRRFDAGAPTEQVDNSLQPGQRIKVESGHTGMQSQLYKCVYVDGEMTERTLLNSDTYNASKAIYRVGPAAPAAVEPAAPAETAPVETTPAETTPAETAPAETVPETQPHPAGPGYEYGPGMPTPAPTEVEAPAETAAAPTEAEAPAETAEAAAPGPG